MNEVRNSIPSKNDIWMINPIDSTTNAQSSNEKNANSNVSTSQNADKQIKSVVTEPQPTVSKTSLTVSENDTQKLPQPAISSQPKVDTQPKNSSSVSSKVVSKELPATGSKSQSSDKPKQTDSKTNANLELGNNGHVKESVKPDASRKPDASGDNKHHALHQGKAGNNNVPHAATSTQLVGGKLWKLLSERTVATEWNTGRIEATACEATSRNAQGDRQYRKWSQTGGQCKHERNGRECQKRSSQRSCA